ncbi:MAG: tetratricopeptide repeat protein [Pyrinomonadaceae bacterium]|nr:tetratricopeptide repeat protein [Pyrinomonadaceae bacterium]
MQLQEHIAFRESDLVANLSERVELLCAEAGELSEAGEIETARSTIAEFWDRVGERPRLDGLDDSAQAELLLRAGALSGWIGSAQQIWGAQEAAKDLISESATIFEKLGLDAKVAEAQIDLAICYWREGGYDEARVTLQQILQRLGDQPSEQKLRALLNCGLVERSSLRYHDSLRIHREAASLFNESGNHALRGKFHNEFATVLTNLGLSERREDYIDQALVEYAAASFHFEQAGHKRFLAAVENNLGFLFVSLGRFGEANDQLDRARSLFEGLKDRGMVAQVDDTRARAFIDQGLYAEAEAVAGRSVRVLEEGDELSLLAEALTTHGRALAKLGNAQLAHSKFGEALNTAQRAGDPESAGVAVLSLGEELADHLPYGELCSYYRIAESLLAESQYPEIKVRLGEYARRLMAVPVAHPIVEAPVRHQTNGKGSAKEHAVVTSAFTNSGPDGSLEGLVLNYEGNLIRRALESSGGSVTRAARLLGITHQGLAFILNGRHRNLLSVRTPVKPRRRSIIRYR